MTRVIPGGAHRAKDMIGLEAFRNGPKRDGKGRTGIGFASFTEQSAHGTGVRSLGASAGSGSIRPTSN
jgi:hypothetical protein